ncbi:MAG: isoprenylcysteine carboxylmethyltransferase family protein [Bacteroidales bacterium]
MSLTRELRNAGNILFRHRSYLPIVLYPLATLVLFIERDALIQLSDIPWSLICLAISFLGLFIRILVIGYVPKGTSGRNTHGQVAETLNTRGIYSIVRHPLYLGNFFMWLGIILYVGSIWFTLVCILLFWIYYERIMFAEEAFLKDKFGNAYADWSKNTPAILPRFRAWKSAHTHFSAKNVLKREYNGLFAVVISFVYVNALKNYVLEHQITIDKLWLFILGAAFILFITLRSLKKYTRLLHVEGR